MAGLFVRAVVVYTHSKLYFNDKPNTVHTIYRKSAGPYYPGMAGRQCFNSSRVSNTSR